MLQTLSRPAPVRRPAPVTDCFEDVSPFGLQGLRRDALQLLKPAAIGRLASTLALTLRRRDIQNPSLVAGILAEHSDWVDEYQTIHLIEKSLWINGHSDLVMTLTPDPSHISDSPPQEILDTLTHAYQLHPDATIWYGVPLFGDQTTSDGLPIPLSAQQVREEHARRIRAAQRHALRFGWFYQAASAGLGLATKLSHLMRGSWRFGTGAIEGFQRSWNIAKRDARRRRRARTFREMEYIRTGRPRTKVPQHTTSFGKATFEVWETAIEANRELGVSEGSLSTSVAGMSLGQLLLFVPMSIISADPFLFLELPDEKGKLRHIGHWYWQDLAKGKHKLHLHL